MKFFHLPITIIATGLVALSGAAGRSHAQGTGVPVYSQTTDAENQLKAAADKMRAAGTLVRETVLTNQFNRSSCALALPAPRETRMSNRELWAVARAAHLRIGWYHLCTKCNHWHIKQGGGYALTTDGAAATCFHVVRPPDNFKEGYLIAADEAGTIYPVTEILAANPDTDAAIIRIRAKKLNPLALNTAVFPGDRCVCFSDPLGERGYFSDGIVSRFLKPPARHGSNPANVTRMDVTTDWAPGSSGSAVLDEFGNAIGHVTYISQAKNTNGAASPTLITIHEAVSAKDVMSLIQ